MEGLTAKVFRTYNASITLQQQLKELTNRKSCPCNCEGNSCILQSRPAFLSLTFYLHTTAWLQFSQCKCQTAEV